jgi:CheY-like chemotaxis protein
MVLRLSGHETHIAHDGLEAVEAAAQVRPDLILLDIGLPKINGYEVYERGHRARASCRLDGLGPGRRPSKVPISPWSRIYLTVYSRSFPPSTVSADSMRS